MFSISIFGRHPNFEFIRMAQLLEEYVRKRKIKPKKLNVRATYPDPCEPVRLGGVLDAPRNVFRRIVTYFVEPPEAGMAGLCCGVGGGLKDCSLQISQAISDTRLKMLIGIGVQVRVSACPNCFLSLSKASISRENPIRVVDIAQLIAEQLE